MTRSCAALAVVATLVASPARADCMASWADTFPPADVELTAEPRVLLMAGGSLERRDLAKAVQFVSGQHHVNVRVVSAFAGYRQQLALLAPVKPLPPGLWDLVLVKPHSGVEPRLGRWTVRDGRDATPPSFTTTPRAGPASWQAYGCGPESLIAIEGVATDEVAVVEVALSVAGAGTKTAVLAPRDGALQLGHGMCSGAFDLPPGTKATVALTPIDVAGNRGEKSVRLDVTAPGPK